MKIKELNRLGWILFVMGAALAIFLTMYAHYNTTWDNEKFIVAIAYDTNVWWLIVPIIILLAEGVYFIRREDNEFDLGKKAETWVATFFVSLIISAVAWIFGYWAWILMGGIPSCLWLIAVINESIITNLKR